jgi:hypothetical protein
METATALLGNWQITGITSTRRALARDGWGVNPCRRKPLLASARDPARPLRRSRNPRYPPRPSPPSRARMMRNRSPARQRLESPI